MVESCKRGNKPTGSIKDGKFVDWVVAASCPRSAIPYGVCCWCRNPLITFYPISKTVIIHTHTDTHHRKKNHNGSQMFKWTVNNFKPPATVGSKPEVAVALISAKSCHRLTYKSHCLLPISRVINCNLNQDYGARLNPSIRSNTYTLPVVESNWIVRPKGFSWASE
jgi:hypothetical protein